MLETKCSIQEFISVFTRSEYSILVMIDNVALIMSDVVVNVVNDVVIDVANDVIINTVILIVIELRCVTERDGTR